MKKYQVIGGQYEPYWYGESDSIRGAKIIAGKHKEFWDNFKGWQIPKIYNAEDCYKIVCNGMVTHYDGEEIIIPKNTAIPIA